MNTTTRRLVSKALALLALVVATLIMSPSAASAYQHTAVSGRPGAALPYQVLGTHLQAACGGPYTGCFQPGLIVQGATVYRSPATTSTQYVTVRYLVQRWIPGFGWSAETSRDVAATMGAGYGSVRTQAWTVPITSGYKNVQYAITWRDAYGRLLGQSVVNFNGSDYGCATQFTWKCTAYVGSVAVYQP
jgi:hypothetical protein